MTVRSGFFNSINGDRIYHTGQWAEYFSSFIGNGVFPNPSNNLQIASNNNMTVTVKAGKAWINGYIVINDNDYILDLTPADGLLNRIDRIVARYDTVGREITLEVKQGVFASSPVAPALQRNADGYELALADVRINAGVISITQANITDTRLNNDLCGIVHGVVEQVDTTTIFNQYQSWINQEKQRFENDVDTWLENEQLDFETWEQQQKSEFDMWFENIQDILDDNVAANLQNQITQLEEDLGNIDAPSTQEFESLQSDFSAHQAESATQAHLAKNIGLEDTEGNFVATEVEGAMNELFTNVSDGKSLVGGAITGVDESVVIPTDPTFGDLASAIGGISTGKKWASGSSNTVKLSNRTFELKEFGTFAPLASFSTEYFYKVDGLSFKPSAVFLTANNNFILGSLFPITTYESYNFANLSGSGKSGLVKVDANADLKQGSFQLPHSGGSNIRYNWVAFE